MKMTERERAVLREIEQMVHDLIDDRVEFEPGWVTERFFLRYPDIDGEHAEVYRACARLGLDDRIDRIARKRSMGSVRKRNQGDFADISMAFPMLPPTPKIDGRYVPIEHFTLEMAMRKLEEHQAQARGHGQAAIDWQRFIEWLAERQAGAAA